MMSNFPHITLPLKLYKEPIMRTLQQRICNLQLTATWATPILALAFAIGCLIAPSSASAMAHAGCIQSILNDPKTIQLPNAGIANCLLHVYSSPLLCHAKKDGRRILITQQVTQPGSGPRIFTLEYYNHAHSRLLYQSKFKTSPKWNSFNCMSADKKCVYNFKKPDDIIFVCN